MACGTSTRAALIACVLMMLCACASPGETSGSGEGSCAYRIQFDGNTFTDTANLQFEVGRELGTAKTLGCLETDENGTDMQEALTVFQIKGIDSSTAVAAGDSASDADVFVLEGSPVPAELKR